MADDKGLYCPPLEDLNITEEDLEEELLFDNGYQEDEESLDGVSRVGELENLLSEVMDYWDEDILVAEPDYVEQVAGLMDHIGVVLANDTEEYPG